MKTLFKRVAISAATAGLLASGLAVAAAPAASAAPCGLDYQVADAPYGPLKIVYYSIRNCHGYTVQRKLDLAGTTDDECLTIHPGQTVNRTRIIAGWAEVRGMKSC